MHDVSLPEFFLRMLPIDALTPFRSYHNDDDYYYDGYYCYLSTTTTMVYV